MGERSTGWMAVMLLLAFAGAVVCIVGAFMLGIDVLKLVYSWSNPGAKNPQGFDYAFRAFIMVLVGKISASAFYGLSGVKNE